MQAESQSLRADTGSDGGLEARGCWVQAAVGTRAAPGNLPIKASLSPEASPLALRTESTDLFLQRANGNGANMSILQAPTHHNVGLGCPFR